MRPASHERQAGLAAKLLVSAWMAAAAAAFVLVSVAPGSRFAAAIPSALMPLRAWLTALFQAASLY